MLQSGPERGQGKEVTDHVQQLCTSGGNSAHEPDEHENGRQNPEVLSRHALEAEADGKVKAKLFAPFAVGEICAKRADRRAPAYAGADADSEIKGV